MSDQEPTYEYRRGEGWVPCIKGGTIWHYVDKRSHDGRSVFIPQVYLVGLSGYNYRDWVDNWGYSYDTLESAIQRVESWQKEEPEHVNGLLERGMKIRIVERNG